MKKLLTAFAIVGLVVIVLVLVGCAPSNEGTNPPSYSNCGTNPE